jgi:ABC-type molybdate transport system substrate-binding protein
MMKHRKKNRLLLLMLTGIVISCNMSRKDTTYNDWNSGSISIATDENLRDITEQLVQIYEHENDSAKIIPVFSAQDKIIHEFVNGNITSMIVGRTLTPREKEIAMQNQDAQVDENIFAYTAVALIANKSFGDSVIDMASLKNYIAPDAASHLVFDNEQSGIPAFVMRKAHLDPALFKNALVVKNEKEVVAYVQRSVNSIGFVSFNLISDPNDAATKELLSTIKVLSVKVRDTIYKISQQSIYDFNYPFQYPISIVLGNHHELVGKGFANFLCRAKASKIILKAGLVPRFMPVRQIKVRDQL